MSDVGDIFDGIENVQEFEQIALMRRLVTGNPLIRDWLEDLRCEGYDAVEAVQLVWRQLHECAVKQSQPST